MAIRTAVIDGKTVKLYPAFRTEAHAHDIEFRRNRVLNDLDDRRDELSDDECERMENLADALTDILCQLSYPITYLPWNLYQIARESIGWAGGMREMRYQYEAP